MLLLLPAFLLIQRSGTSQTAPYALIDSVNFKSELLGVPYGNVIKMYGVAVDERRGLAYTSTSQTEFISRLSTNSMAETGTVVNPFGPNLTTINVNPANGYLLLSDPDGAVIRQRLVNPANSNVLGTYYLFLARGSRPRFSPPSQPRVFGRWHEP